MTYISEMVKPHQLLHFFMGCSSSQKECETSLSVPRVAQPFMIEYARSITIPMLLIDGTTLDIIWCNNEVSRRLSYSLAILIGKNLSFIVPQLPHINPVAPRPPPLELVRVATAHSIPQIFAMRMTPLRCESEFRWMISLHEPSLITDMSLLVSRLLYHDLGNTLQLLNSVETRRNTALQLLGVRDQVKSPSLIGDEEDGVEESKMDGDERERATINVDMKPLREARSILKGMRVNIPEMLQCSTNRRFNTLPHDGDVVVLLCAAMKQASTLTPDFEYILELDKSIVESGSFPVTASSLSCALLGVCYFVSYHAFQATGPSRAVFKAKILHGKWLALLVSFEAIESDETTLSIIPEYFVSSGNLRQLVSTHPGESSFSSEDVHTAMRDVNNLEEKWTKTESITFKQSGIRAPMRPPDMQIGIARVLLRTGCFGDIHINSIGSNYYHITIVCPKISSQNV